MKRYTNSGPFCCNVLQITPAMAAKKMCRDILLCLLILIPIATGDDIGELSCSKDGLDCSVLLINPDLNSLDQGDPKLVEEVKKRLGPIPPLGKNFRNK